METATTVQKGPNTMNANGAYDANPWGSLLWIGMAAKHKAPTTIAKATPASLAARSSKYFDGQDAGG
ncbi:MAG TPA: hypothetical protein VGP63_29150 [Planctomycetaceae bacterium]|nr:hypothetical protein [Planctomycetaceae bacterium]